LFAVETVGPVMSRYPGLIALVYRHWPIAGHRFAYPAARAAECAGAQGKFFQYHDRIFAQQDSLGFKGFDVFARESEVPDVPRFEECMKETGEHAVVERDRRAARSIGGTGTPTVVINGQRFREPPDAAMLDSVVNAILRSAR
jgi:protein-disulfide isomerase